MKDTSERLRGVRRFASLTMLALAIPLVAVGVTFAGTGIAKRTSAPPTSEQPSEPTDVTLSAEEAAFLESIEQETPTFAAGVVQALTVRGGIAFYRVENRAGGDCFAVSRAGSSQRLGAFMCPADFPSASTPVLDVTVTHGRPGTTETRVWRSVGFAADHVATIAFTTDSGALTARTPVRDGIYVVTRPPTQHVTEIVALDAAGQQIWRKPVG